MITTNQFGAGPSIPGGLIFNIMFDGSLSDSEITFTSQEIGYNKRLKDEKKHETNKTLFYQE
jgi:hypothetical protein